MNIVFYEATPGEQQTIAELFKSLLPDAKLSFSQDKLGSENLGLARDADVISVFINSQVGKELIDQIPNLKLITTRSTGFDHIDVASAAARNVQVANVPSYGSRTVAEFTFALILGLSRKTMPAYQHVKERHDFDYSSFRGFDLNGKTLGVVGTGKIGTNVIQIATKGFNMKVVAFDAYPNQEKAAELGFAYTDLNSLLAQSDIVTIHTPYNQTTHHLINKTNIVNLKKGAMLINTARGEIIETEAILDAIKNNTLAAAGLDVLEGEREMKDEFAHITSSTESAKMHEEQFKILLEDHMLIDLPQVAITPHMAFFTDEAKQEILQTTVGTIIAFSKNNPINLVK